MWKRFCNWYLYKHLGWTAEVTEDHPDKFIICLAPHTSNWDFLIGQLYIGARGMRSNFLMKKEWFFFPLGILFKKLGGIPVYRQKHTSMTDSMAETAKAAREFHLCITPEGTRSPNGIPILLYGVDYEKKHIQCTKTIIPSGDLEADMRKIKLYFKDFKGKKPENFTIGNLS